jgi:hypothetical protein
MKKSETSHPSIEYLMEYQAKAWESRSNIPQQELDRRKNLNEQLREAEESKREKKPKTTIAATFSKASEEHNRTR